MSKSSPGGRWQYAPIYRILAGSLTQGESLLLIVMWSHAKWDGDPRGVYGLCWASVETLSKMVHAANSTVGNQLRSLRGKGLVVRLRDMTPGERVIADAGRAQNKLAPLVCQCPSVKRSKWADECSCRVLRPINPGGRPELLPQGVECLEGRHVERAVHGPPSQPREGAPLADQGGAPLADQGGAPLAAEGQTNQENPCE